MRCCCCYAVAPAASAPVLVGRFVDGQPSHDDAVMLQVQPVTTEQLFEVVERHFKCVCKIYFFLPKLEHTRIQLDRNSAGAFKKFLSLGAYNRVYAFPVEPLRMDANPPKTALPRPTPQRKMSPSPTSSHTANSTLQSRGHPFKAKSFERIRDV